jgi:membrane protein YqaA with SNARE-associated domain
MLIESYHKIARKFISTIQKFVNRIWFGPLLIFLSMCDSLIVIIPTTGIMVSSTLVQRKKWWRFGVYVAIGSALGAFIIVLLTKFYGLEKISLLAPTLTTSSIWKWTLYFFKQYGLVVVFVVGLMPLSQQPALILATLSKVSLAPLVAAIICSRLIKFPFIAYLASHAPKLLGKIWGIKFEIEDVDILKGDNHGST